MNAEKCASDSDLLLAKRDRSSVQAGSELEAEEQAPVRNTAANRTNTSSRELPREPCTPIPKTLHCVVSKRTDKMDSGIGFLEGAPSPRVRVLKHLSNQKAALVSAASANALTATATEEDEDNDPNKPKELPPNSMQLYSYYGRCPYHYIVAKHALGTASWT